MRPYHREWMQRHIWREFGTCQLGNWALAHRQPRLHVAEGPRAVARRRRPAPQQPPPRIRVEARKTSGINRLSFPRGRSSSGTIPARAELPPITITWYNGDAPGVEELRRLGHAPTLRQKDKNNWRFAGTLIVGTKGSIHTTGHNMWFRLLPEDRFEGVQRDRPGDGRATRAARSRIASPPAAAASAPGPTSTTPRRSTSSSCWATSPRSSRATLEFDPIAMKIVNNAEADALLRCEYRQPWTL